MVMAFDSWRRAANEIPGQHAIPLCKIKWNHITWFVCGDAYQCLIRHSVLLTTIHFKQSSFSTSRDINLYGKRYQMYRVIHGHHCMYLLFCNEGTWRHSQRASNKIKTNYWRIIFLFGAWFRIQELWISGKSFTNCSRRAIHSAMTQQSRTFDIRCTI